MSQACLDVTFRRGKALAAYYSLPRKAEDRAVRTALASDGLVVDYAADGRPIGIEITSPRLVTLSALNRVLTGLGQPPATADDLAPLLGRATAA